jgi:hypothetical protein
MTSAVLGRHKDAIYWPRIRGVATDPFWGFAESCKLHDTVTLHARSGAT